MKFAHLGDCHLGGWRQPQLNELNLKAFQQAIDTGIQQKVDFILIAGDLFDSPYPPIDTLKDTFNCFKKIKDAKIPVFLIAGSHDYSISGKTFLDVLEQAGFCQNVARFEQHGDDILLNPTVYQQAAIYGYPGKKSAMEVEDIERIKLQDTPGLFKILMLHTAIKDAVPTLPLKAVDQDKLPEVDYLALSHLHINYQKPGRAYSGPTFPTDLAELEELQGGSFYIIENGIPKRHEIKLNEICSITLEISNALSATDMILEEVKRKNLQNKIVIIKCHGILQQGTTADINFPLIEKECKNLGALVVLKSTAKLHMNEPSLTLNLVNAEDVESQILKQFETANPGPFNAHTPGLLRALEGEKLDDETSAIFQDRLLAECKKVLKIS